LTIRVDCLMPTLPARDALRQRAIASFTQQAVPEDWQVSLSIDADTEKTLGEKINRMVERSRADFFVLMDDDDWHSRTRVFEQVSPLAFGRDSAQFSDASLKYPDFTGTSLLYYFDARSNEAHLYRGDGDWLGGLAFKRAVWERCKFQPTTHGVDYLWQRHSRGKKLDLANPRLFVAGLHANNTCPKCVTGHNWSKFPVAGLPAEFLSDLNESRFAIGGLIEEGLYLVGEGSCCPHA